MATAIPVVSRFALNHRLPTRPLPGPRRRTWRMKH